MTLQNHLSNNTTPLTTHQHILFPTAKTFVSRNQTHFPQNPSPAGNVMYCARLTKLPGLNTFYCSLNKERTTPGSIAPVRVPILEVVHMAADLDTLAGTVHIHRPDRSLLSDQERNQVMVAVLKQARCSHSLGGVSDSDFFPWPSEPFLISANSAVTNVILNI